ncbi:MAG: crossover junction endodeoxyribonuclease RuvC [Dethiobacteria bacterium]|jgi:crossover junction endodeoxyribonuclease RuvC
MYGKDSGKDLKNKIIDEFRERENGYMRLIGIDPGLALIGYGIVEEMAGREYSRIDSGCICTEKRMSIPDRLKTIHIAVDALIKEYKPDALIMEKIFFNKNVTTAIKVGEARGVILLAASLYDLEVFEYTPLQIKQTVAGYGRATKDQVEKMVKIHLNIFKHTFRHDDESDALAVCLCHLQQSRWAETVERRSKID